MAVVSNSAVSFRNMAYNMFFKRTSTTLMFVMGACEHDERRSVRACVRVRA